jgi:hypothetical protein
MNRLQPHELAQATQKYVGVNCDDYKIFIVEQVVNQQLKEVLFTVEDKIHGPVHFTIGK